MSNRPHDEDELFEVRADGTSGHTIMVRGDIDISSAPRLHAVLVNAIETPADEVTVDLSGLSFIDSTGLGVLVNAHHKARRQGMALRYVLPEGRARFPFEVTGLVAVFEGSDALIVTPAND